MGSTSTFLYNDLPTFGIILRSPEPFSAQFIEVACDELAVAPNALNCSIILLVRHDTITDIISWDDVSLNTTCKRSVRLIKVFTDVTSANTEEALICPYGKNFVIINARAGRQRLHTVNDIYQEGEGKTVSTVLILFLLFEQKSGSPLKHPHENIRMTIGEQISHEFLRMHLNDPLSICSHSFDLGRLDYSMKTGSENGVLGQKAGQDGQHGGG
jgi:hypothetical protein